MLTLAVFLNTGLGIYSAFFFIFVYLLLTLGFFLLTFLIYHFTGTPIAYIYDITSLNRTRPFLAYLLSFNMLSLAGVPPLAGFFSKITIFYYVVIL